MDYSQFLNMREELSLIAVLLLLFLADLFMSPDAHKNSGKARLNTMLPVILMAIHTAINLIPGTATDAICPFPGLLPSRFGKFLVVWRILKPLLQGVSPAPKQGPQKAVRMIAPASIRSEIAPFFTRSENTGWEEG